jgi:hypothetical protein
MSVNLPLESVVSTTTTAALQSTFQWKVDANQSTTVTATTITDIQSLFQSALQGPLSPLSTFSTTVYSDGTVRNITAASDNSDPLLPTSGTLKTYLLRYLYENMTAAIGLAATTGDLDILLERNGVPAADLISAEAADLICSSIQESAHELRKSILAQMQAAVPERFTETPAPSDFTALPFLPNDSLSLRITFQFPATMITAPVSEHILRIQRSNLYLDVGSKITVRRPATVTNIPFSSFPSCTVYLRVILPA